MERGTERVKRGLAEMLKGGVIMDVTNSEQARIAEGMAAGCAVVASAIGACTAVAGGAAELVTPNDPDALADALTGLLREPDRLAALAARGGERVAAFDRGPVVAGYLAAYEDAIKVRASSG